MLTYETYIIELGQTPTTNNHHFPAQWLVAIKRCTVEANTCTLQGSHKLWMSQTVTRLEINRTPIRGCYKMLCIYLYWIYILQIYTYHIISYHIVSYRIVSYRIIYHMYELYLVISGNPSVLSIPFRVEACTLVWRSCGIFWYLVFCGVPKKTDLHPKTISAWTVARLLFFLHEKTQNKLWNLDILDETWWKNLHDFSRPQPLHFKLCSF